MISARCWLLAALLAPLPAPVHPAIGAVGKYAWVLFLLVACVNLAILSRTAGSAIRRRPDLALGYRRLLLVQALVMTLPWVLMGVGCLASDITVWHYLKVRDANPWVLAWWGLLGLAWVLGFFWLFFFRGAEFVVTHRDLWGPWKARVPSTPLFVKLTFLLASLGPAWVRWLSFSGFLPVPS